MRFSFKFLISFYVVTFLALSLQASQVCSHLFATKNDLKDYEIEISEGESKSIDLITRIHEYPDSPNGHYARQGSTRSLLEGLESYGLHEIQTSRVLFLADILVTAKYADIPTRNLIEDYVYYWKAYDAGFELSANKNPAERFRLHAEYKTWINHVFKRIDRYKNSYLPRDVVEGMVATLIRADTKVRDLDEAEFKKLMVMLLLPFNERTPTSMIVDRFLGNYRNISLQ